MPTINIYVSDELKASLDEVGRALNMSAVCQRALETAVQTTLQGLVEAHVAYEILGHRPVPALRHVQYRGKKYIQLTAIEDYLAEKLERANKRRAA